MKIGSSATVAIRLAAAMPQPLTAQRPTVGESARDLALSVLDRRTIVPIH
ncbi:MAG: hypothetical protein ACRELE_08840 [Gemmatimonadales bacterium]